MAKRVLYFLFFLFSVILLGYVSLPNFDFPAPPPDSLQSQEPADTESPLRRAYFTNYSREEVMSWYIKQFTNSSFGNIHILTYRLNYPPEDSQTIIRDQTRSTFLEEVVHPFRESVYVNGFEPKEAKDAINIAGLPWRQKIIIRYVPSSVWVRLIVSSFSLGLIFLIAKEYAKYLKKH